MFLAVAGLDLQRDRLADEVAQHRHVLAFLFQEQVDHGLRGDDAEFLGVELARLAQDFAQDLVAQRARRAHRAARFAGGAGFAHLVRQRIPGALAGHLHQPQLAEAADRRAGAVARQGLVQFGQHGSLVSGVVHVDEVQHDDPAQVAQPQLAGDGDRRLQVGLEDRVVEIASAHESARVHVHRRQGLGLVDDQVAARLQVHAAGQGAGDFLVHVRRVEQRPVAAVVMDAVRHGRRVALRPFHQLLGHRARIDRDGGRVGRRHVPQHALRQGRLDVDGGRRRHLADAGLDVGPQGAQVGDVGRQLFVAGVLGLGAHDESAGFVLGLQRHQPLAQRVAFRLVADALGNADVRFVRQVDQHPPGDADVGGQPRALGPQRILDHLDQQGLALEQQLLDGGLRRMVAAADASVAVLPQVRHVDEGRPLLADVHEGALHAGQHPGDAAQVQIADMAALDAAFDMQFLHDPLGGQGHAGFERSDVDEDVFAAGHGGLFFYQGEFCMNLSPRDWTRRGSFPRGADRPRGGRPAGAWAPWRPGFHDGSMTDLHVFKKACYSLVSSPPGTRVNPRSFGFTEWSSRFRRRAEVSGFAGVWPDPEAGAGSEDGGDAGR